MHAFGGEVLKFIGDGVLAIFPVTGVPAESCEAALRAIGAARAGMAHLDAARQAQGPGGIPLGLKVGTAFLIGTSIPADYSQLLRRAVHVLQCSFGVWIRGVAQDADAGKLRKQLFEELQSLGLERGGQVGKSSNITLGAREVRNDSDVDGVADGAHDDRDCAGRLLGGNRRRCCTGEGWQLQLDGAQWGIVLEALRRYKAQALMPLES